MRRHLKDYDGKEQRQLSFIRWIVAPNKNDKTGKRGTLILEFWCAALNTTVLCYHDIGSGHLTKQGQNAGTSRTGHKIKGGFRVTQGSGVHKWMLEQRVEVKRLREAHVGLMAQMKKTQWIAPVIRAVNSKKGDYEYRTVLELLTRGELSDDIPF